MPHSCEPPRQASIGPIRLSPGVPRREVFIFLLIAGVASALTTFFNVMQPYVFNEILLIPKDRQGQLAGELMTMQQTVILLGVSLAGVLADRIGRKVLLVFALAGFGLSAILYPLAGAVFVLFLIRFLFGLASTAHTAGGPAKLYDYPDNASRGKFMAMVMIFYALVTVLMIGAIGGHVPGWLTGMGYTARQAGTFALWGAGALGLGAALVAALFMQDDRPCRPAAASRPVMAAGLDHFRALGSHFREVAAHARGNRRFGVLLLTSFIVRTDEAVVASFFALWITLQGAAEGLSSAQSLVIAGMVTAVLRGASFVVPPVLGVLLDQHNRLVIYLVTLVLVGVSFTSTLLVGRVGGWEIFALAAFIGLTETAQTISQQALFGEEAPAHLRGTAYGLLAFFGTGSVVVIALLAGYLFDHAGPTAPFVLIGAMHIVFSALAVLYLRRGAKADALAAANGG